VPRVREISRKEGVSEDDAVIELTEADLLPLEDEADAALEMLDSELLEDVPPPLPPAVQPPPIPEAARSRNSRKVTAGSHGRSIEESLTEMNERLLKETMGQIEGKLNDLYNRASEKDPDKEQQISDVRIALLEIVGQLYEFSEVFVSGKQNNEAAVERLQDCLMCLTKMRTHAEKMVADVFEEIFQEFGDIIDEQLVTRYIREKNEAGEGVSYEDAVRAVYHRTPEGMEAIKEKNRARAAEVVTQLAKKDHLTLEDIESLHMANNRSIVPKQTSHMRSRPNENVTFFKRFGLAPQHVQSAMEDVVARANALWTDDKVGRRAYAVEAAKLHNDMLDIHPFGDRNGSTSMLFLETLMAHRGYQPKATREKRYYRHLSQVVGGNLVAMGTVAYQQVVTAQVYGYYMSPEIADNPKLKALYDEAKLKRRAQMQRDERAYSAAVKAAKDKARAKQKEDIAPKSKRAPGEGNQLAA